MRVRAGFKEEGLLSIKLAKGRRCIRRNTGLDPGPGQHVRQFREKVFGAQELKLSARYGVRYGSEPPTD